MDTGRGKVRCSVRGDKSRQLPRRRIAFGSQHSHPAGLDFGRGCGQPFGEDAHEALLVTGIVASDNVIAEHCFELPSFTLCQLGKAAAAEQALFLAGEKCIYDSRRKYFLAEDASRL